MVYDQFTQPRLIGKTKTWDQMLQNIKIINISGLVVLFFA